MAAAVAVVDLPGGVALMLLPLRHGSDQFGSPEETHDLVIGRVVFPPGGFVFGDRHRQEGREARGG